MKRKRTNFDEVLKDLRRRNVARLKQRAFAANCIAKLTSGRSRHAAYRVKDRSISRLLALGEAQVLRLYGQPIGVQFQSGGHLHLRMPVSLEEAVTKATRISAGLMTIQEPAREVLYAQG